jgi:hypothetical protein
MLVPHTSQRNVHKFWLNEARNTFSDHTEVKVLHQNVCITTRHHSPWYAWRTCSCMHSTAQGNIEMMQPLHIRQCSSDVQSGCGKSLSKHSTV